jgi:negative regulator of flagellin synthesis FlgM
MKITHNKVGQNLNLVDGAKAERAGTKGTAASTPADEVKANALADIGSSASKVEVSPKAQEAKRIKEIALNTPDIDEAKVARFRQMIDEGTYKVDAKAVAERLVDEHLSMEDLKNG